jgi:hypothetical protein
MINFELSSTVIKTIIDELSDAEEFIRIAIFQLHNKKIFNILKRKLAKVSELKYLHFPTIASMIM